MTGNEPATNSLPQDTLGEEKRKLLNSLVLQNVSLRETHADCSVFPLSITPENSSVNVELNTKWQHIPQAQLLVCFFGATTKGMPKEGFPGLTEFDKPIFNINVVYSGVYKIMNELPGTPDFEWFTQANATFNLYPYLREWVDGTSRRMSIPIVILPFFRGLISNPEKK